MNPKNLSAISFTKQGKPTTSQLDRKEEILTIVLDLSIAGLFPREPVRRPDTPGRLERKSEHHGFHWSGRAPNILTKKEEGSNRCFPGGPTMLLA